MNSVIGTIFVHAAEYDAVLAYAAAQKEMENEKERKEYLDMQEHKADADDRMLGCQFCISLGVVG